MMNEARMNGTRNWNSTRLLDAVSGMLALLALVFLLLPARASVAVANSTSVVAIAAPAMLSVDVSNAVTERIVAGNVFSASRRAPSQRFAPPGTETAVAPTNDASLTAVGGNDGDVARLYGIVVQDGQMRALLQLPGADSSTKLMSVGDVRAGVRLLRITADRVVLATPSGLLTVRLIPRTPSDSTEKRP